MRLLDRIKNSSRQSTELQDSFHPPSPRDKCGRNGSIGERRSVCAESPVQIQNAEKQAERFGLIAVFSTLPIVVGSVKCIYAFLNTEHL